MARILSEPFYERVRNSVQFTEKQTVTRLPIRKRGRSGSGSRSMLLCTAKEDMDPLSVDNVVDLWRAQEGANPIRALDADGVQITIEEVHFDWITGGEKISKDKQIMIESIDGEWCVAAADCEDKQTEPHAQRGD